VLWLLVYYFSPVQASGAVEANVRNINTHELMNEFFDNHQFNLYKNMVKEKVI
jgi:hypothetical protein